MHVSKVGRAILCCLLLAVLLCGYAAAEDTEKAAPYEIVVPAKYDRVGLQINDDWFTTLENDNTMRLRDFSGRELMRDNGIGILGDWIDDKNQEGCMLLSRDLKPVLPKRYRSIAMTGTAQCTVVEPEDRSWRGDYGTLVQYDLVTGETKTAGKEYDFMIPRDPQYTYSLDSVYKSYPDGKGGSYQAESFDVHYLPSGKKTVVNRYGQTIIPPMFFEGDYVAPNCSPFRIYTSGDSYLYTRRGRRIAQYHGGFGSPIGNWYVQEGNSIIDLEGKTVVSAADLGDRVLYRQIYYNSGVKNGVMKIDRDRYWVFEENGKYGILRLPAYVPEPDDWAKEEAGKADAMGLISDEQKIWWRDSCTREEFCQILMKAVALHTGKTAEQLTEGLASVDLYDATDASAMAAAKLQLVKGYGNGSFAPDRLITREEAAVMLARAAAYLKIQGTGEPVEFTDIGQISDWAKDGVETVSAIVGGGSLPVMRGTQPGIFSPQGRYTVEQAAVTFYRLLGAA